MLDKKVRVGIIGCGGISRKHISDFLAHPEAEIAALVDTSDESMSKTLERFPDLARTPTFKDYREMLNGVGLDAVEINTPHTLHYPQAMDSFDRGLHALIEKPMVCSVAHAKDLIAKAKQKKLVLQVAYQRHFAPPFLYMKDQIQSGAIGEINYIAAVQCQNWRKGTGGTWRQKPELSGGGQLNDSGSHLLDIVMWVTGLSVSSVAAFIDNRGTPVDINSAVSVVFTNGARGTLSVIGDAPVGFLEDIHFVGSQGVIRYSNGKVAQTGGDGKLQEQTELPEASSMAGNFIDAIFGRDEVRSPGECGLSVIELTEAAWKSAETGMPCAVERT